MKFEHTLRYDASPEEVFAMLGEAVFRERVCEAQHVTECTATVDGVVGNRQWTPDTGTPGATDHTDAADGATGWSLKGKESTRCWTGPSLAPRTMAAVSSSARPRAFRKRRTSAPPNRRNRNPSDPVPPGRSIPM